LDPTDPDSAPSDPPHAPEAYDPEGSVSVPPSLCDEAILNADFIVESPALNLYVASGGLGLGSGTQEEPFTSIGAAMNSEAFRAGGRPVRLVVASGSYDERVLLPHSVQLYGGYDPVNWERETASGPSILTGDVSMESWVEDSPAVLDGFEVIGVISTLGRAILQNNLFTPLLSEEVIASAADVAVWNTTVSAQKDSVLLLQHNTLVNPAPGYNNVVSIGAYLHGACARISHNRFIGAHTPIGAWDSTVIVDHNVSDHGYGGFSFAATKATVVANYIQLVRDQVSGCDDASDTDTHNEGLPQVVYHKNTFQLHGANARGIHENCVDCDPLEVTDNIFITSGDARTLYSDYVAVDASAPVVFIDDITALNTLPDIVTYGNVHLSY
jgi:hypothetical protein